MKKVLFVFLCLLISVVVMAQSRGKQTLQARMLTSSPKSVQVKKSPTAAKTLEVVIKLEKSTMDATLEQLKAAGLTLHARLGQQVSATMPLDAMYAVEQLPGVIRIAAHTTRPKVLSDVTRKDIRSSEIDGEQGYVGPQPYTGKGVTIILLDTGFDFQHPAFYDEQGNCRIKAVYMPCDEQGPGVEIEGMTLPGSYYDVPSQIAQLTTDNTYMYHGSHTAAIAAGTRSPQGFGGVAPDADIVLCCTSPNKNEDDPTPLSELVSNPSIFNSLAFVSHYAKQHQQRVVVNASMGINNGSHNGNGVITEAFEALCQQGIPVVLSVGNEGDTRTTLHKTFESDDDVLRGMIGSSFSLLEGYTFADVPLTMQLSLVRQDMDYYLDGSEGGFTTLWQSPVLDADSGSLLYVSSDDDETLAEWFKGEMNIGVQKGKEGTSLACYYQGTFINFDCRFELSIRSCQGTELYLFGGNLDSMEREGYSNSEIFMTMSDWATAPDVISVGAYSANGIKRNLRDEPNTDDKNKVGDIADFSSYGTGLNGVQCPTLSAPGVNVVSAVSHYYVELENQMADDDDDDDLDDVDLDSDNPNGHDLGRGFDGLYDDEPDGESPEDDDSDHLGPPREEMMWNGYHYTSEEGTSQAAPAVAGTIALWLEADPTLTVSEIKDILSRSCRTDEFTLASPDKFGYGKVDAKRGLELVLERLSTGISQIPDAADAVRHSIFMMDGRRVIGTPTRGLYVVDGKKVVVK